MTLKSSAPGKKGATKLNWRRSSEKFWKSLRFYTDRQSDCSKNMPPSNMQYMVSSLTYHIANILCIDDE